MKEFYKSQYPMKDFLISVKEVHWTNGPIMVNQQDRQLLHMEVFGRMNQWQMMTSDNFSIILSHVMIIYNQVKTVVMTHEKSGWPCQPLVTTCLQPPQQLWRPDDNDSK